MDGLLALTPILLWVLIFIVIFLGVRNYFYSHPSPTLKKIEEQNQILIRKVECLEEQIEQLQKEGTRDE